MKKKVVTDSFLNRHKHLLVLLSYMPIIFIAYSSSLNGTWAMDDILLNKTVGLNDIRKFIGFRKITLLTFLLNQIVTPLNPAGFRVFNILLHVVNAFLVYILAYKTVYLFFGKCRQCPKTSGKNKNVIVPDNRPYLIALLSGLIFGLHPININAVSYIVQRMAALSTFFVLLSILFYIMACESKNRSKMTVFYALCGLSIFAGIFAKENAVMAIPLILLYDYVFLSGFDHKLLLKRAAILSGIGIIVIAFASYYLRLHYVFIDLVRLFINLHQPLSQKGWMAVDVYWTPLQHVLTEFRVVSRYLSLIFVPVPKFLVFDWWGYRVSENLIKPLSTLLSIVFVLSLLLFSIIKIKKFPFLSFGVLWYLIAISLESFFALGSDLYFEHRNYLPVTGLFLGIVGQIGLSLKVDTKKKSLWIIFVLLCLSLGSLTFVRNLVWKDSLTLWQDTLNKVPYNIRALKAVGNTYLKLLDLKNAETNFMRALKESSIRKSPQLLDESVFALGMIYLYKGEFEEAKELINRYENTIESYRPKILKGYYYILNDDIDAALSEFDKVGDADGVYKTMLFTLRGDAYRSKGWLDKAMEEYSKAINEDISWASAYHGIGVTHMIKRDIQRAEEYFEKALSVEPDNVLVLSDMVDLMLIKREPPEKALAYAQRAISKTPPFYQPYLAMGNVLLFEGKEWDAERFYRDAIQKGAKEYMVILNKARVYHLKGEQMKSKEYILRLRNFPGLPLRIKELLSR